MVTVPPSGVNFKALSSRLETSRCNFSLSPAMNNSSPFRQWRTTPASSAAGRYRSVIFSIRPERSTGSFLISATPFSVRVSSSMVLIIFSILAHSSATSHASSFPESAMIASSAFPCRRVTGVFRSCATLSEIVRSSLKTFSVFRAMALNARARSWISRHLLSGVTRTE